MEEFYRSCEIVGRKFVRQVDNTITEKIYVKGCRAGGEEVIQGETGPETIFILTTIQNGQNSEKGIAA